MGAHGDVSIDVDPEIPDNRHRQHRCVADANRTGRDLVLTSSGRTPQHLGLGRVKQWFKQRLILSVSKPSISQRSQIKEDIVEPFVPAGEFNLKAYAPIT